MLVNKVVIQTMSRPGVSILFTLAMFAVMLAPGPVLAQPAPAGGPPAQEQGPTLTDQQKAMAKSILSKYNPDSLTAEDARAIVDAFNAAGLRGGPALGDVIREAGFDPGTIRRQAPPPGTPNGGSPAETRPPASPENSTATGNDRPRPGGGYSIEQAISDRAQMTTIAFDALAFMTGGFGCNTFLPPGKVSDYFGFQYMRDVDAGEMGHNTSFLTRIANNMLAILNDRQRQQLVSLAEEQEPGIKELAYKRFPLIKAFCRLRDGDLPKGTDGLDEDAVKKYSAEIYALSGRLACRRAQVLGAIVRSFDAEQKAELKKLVFGDSRTWPEISDQIDKRSLSHAANVAVMTYASELFSWYAGSVDADAYFCPEGHGTYFGSFYMKDMPAMGHPNFSISTTITGDNGEQMLNVLSEQQRELITGLVDRQRSDLEGIVARRRDISTLLRQFMTRDSVDQQQVVILARLYGKLDGEISYLYATSFAAVYKTLTRQQKSALMKLRGADDGEYPGVFVYSDPITAPSIPNTDFLFHMPFDE
jgi:Spy/CpxP family protein refolding chaperone